MIASLYFERLGEFYWINRLVGVLLKVLRYRNYLKKGNRKHGHRKNVGILHIFMNVLEYNFSMMHDYIISFNCTAIRSFQIFDLSVNILLIRPIKAVVICVSF